MSKINKTVSTTVGLVILAAAVVVLMGGAFTYQQIIAQQVDKILFDAGLTGNSFGK